ncbi:MAG: hypothetical protein ABI303_01080 [Candidatus Saccharimonas sp.]
MSNFEAPRPADDQPHDPTADYHTPSVEHVIIDQAPVSEVDVPVIHEAPTSTSREQDSLEAEADAEARVAEAIGHDAALLDGYDEAKRKGTLDVADRSNTYVPPTVRELVDDYDKQGRRELDDAAEAAGASDVVNMSDDEIWAALGVEDEPKA